MPAATIAAVLLISADVRADAKAVFLDGHEVHPGRLLARYAQGEGIARPAAALDDPGIAATHAYTLTPGLVVLELDPPAALAAAAKPDGKLQARRLREQIEALMATGLFEYVEPDYIVRTLAEPFDSAYTGGTLWGLNNHGQSGGLLGADIGAAAAWDLTTGSTEVIVAVIDTGIRYTHHDLAGQMWRNPGEVPGNGIDDDGDGYIDNVFGIDAIARSGNPWDENDHGTHVAGTIGAAANNGHPHVGVAWNVRLMACKFLDEQGSGSLSDAIRAIDFAVGKGAKILNNSWGGGGYSQALRDSIAGANNQGVLFVAAAGNESNDNDRSPAYPASYQSDNVISVAATDRNDRMATFSNFGRDSVHLGAPGADIYSTASDSDDSYKTFSGTSMAAPHVSGAAALIMAHYPDITLSELRQRLISGTAAVPALNGTTTTGGRLNVFNSLTVQPDGILEIEITSETGVLVPAGTNVAVRVRVTDLLNVNNATVTGQVQNGGSITFRNDGAAPDATAGDGVYTGWLPVPPDAPSVSLTVAITAPGKQPAQRTVVFTVIHPPPNDAFANRIPIPAASGSASGSNENATRETGERTHAGVGGGRSVWWTWTAPAGGIATFSTEGSDFDTVVAVYSGTSLSNLQLRGENDDVIGSVTSEAICRVQAGDVLHIAVDGYAGDTGRIFLNASVTPPFPNDSFQNRTPLSGINFSIRASNFGATRQTGEPLHDNVSGGASVWWTWTAPATTRVALSTIGSTFDTVLAVYRGATLGSLVWVASNDDSEGYHSEVMFDATAGTAYQIAIDGWGGDSGSILLALAAAPVNDRFVNRLPLQGAFVEASGYTMLATKDSGEPSHAFNSGGKSIWWTWVAPADGYATVSTAGSTFDTILGIYRGTLLSNLIPVAENDDFWPRAYWSQTTFQVTAGTIYHIAVDGYRFNLTGSGFASLLISLNGASRLGLPARAADGSYKVELTAQPGKTYTLQRSTDLSVWTPFQTNLLSGKTILFLDQDAQHVSRRYYRALPTPFVDHTP